MVRAALAALALGLVLALAALLLRRKAASDLPWRRRDGGPDLRDMAWAEATSAVHYNRTLKNLQEFRSLVQDSYVQARCTPELMQQLLLRRRRVQKNLLEIWHRLPNDRCKLDPLEGELRRLQEAMAVHMEDVRLRGGLPKTAMDAADDWRQFYEMP